MTDPVETLVAYEEGRDYGRVSRHLVTYPLGVFRFTLALGIASRGLENPQIRLTSAETIEINGSRKLSSEEVAERDEIRATRDRMIETAQLEEDRRILGEILGRRPEWIQRIPTENGEPSEQT